MGGGRQTKTKRTFKTECKEGQNEVGEQNQAPHTYRVVGQIQHPQRAQPQEDVVRQGRQPVVAQVQPRQLTHLLEEAVRQAVHGVVRQVQHGHPGHTGQAGRGEGPHGSACDGQVRQLRVGEGEVSHGLVAREVHDPQGLQVGQPAEGVALQAGAAAAAGGERDGGEGGGQRLRAHGGGHARGLLRRLARAAHGALLGACSARAEEDDAKEENLLHCGSCVGFVVVFVCCFFLWIR